MSADPEAESPAPSEPIRSIGPEHVNPVDPELSAVPGAEKRNYKVPLSILGGILLVVALWAILSPHGPRPPILKFENQDLGCRFEYPSELRSGPNYLRSDGGSLLTIERHSLYMAKKDWVAGLPDVLFSQVMIQLDENYGELVEQSRSTFVMDGSKALKVVLTGRAHSANRAYAIKIVIAATGDWVYVLRLYAPAESAAKEEPLFQPVLTTWNFIRETSSEAGVNAPPFAGTDAPATTGSGTPPAAAPAIPPAAAPGTPPAAAPGTPPAAAPGTPPAAGTSSPSGARSGTAPGSDGAPK